MNVFAGWYTINEWLNESVEQNNDPLRDLDWEKIKLDGAWLYNTKKLKDLPEDNWNISVEENKEQEQNISEQERKIDKGVYSHLINWLVAEGTLEQGEWELIKEALVNNSDIETALKSLEWLDSETKEIVINKIKEFNYTEGDNQEQSNTEVINSRYEANTWYTNTEVQDKLTNKAEREKNKDKALKLFYNKWDIKWIIEWTNSDPKIASEKLERFNSDAYQEDLQIIMWNFVTNVEWETLKEVFKDWEWAEDSARILESLNLAFEMQIVKLTEWKANYNIETVEDLVLELREWDPFEKLEKFEQIKSLVNTSEWTKGKKSNEFFQNIQTWREEKEKSLEERFNNLKEQVENAKKLKNEKKENLEIEKEIESLIIDNNEAEVIPAGDLDILLKEIQEILWEQA